MTDAGILAWLESVNVASYKTLDYGQAVISAIRERDERIRLEARLDEHILDCRRCIPQHRCISYPRCDGDLPGEKHSEACLARGKITAECSRRTELEAALEKLKRGEG